MKTSILKYDYKTQLGLLALNIICVAMFWSLAYPVIYLQIIIAVYQLISNLLHLVLKHKSLGYSGWRTIHLFLTLAYPPVVLLLAFTGYMTTLLFTTLYILIPQLLLFAYTHLCKRELDFIEEREFHILK